MKPLIGITCKYSYDGNFAVEHGIGVQGQQWHLLAHDYVHAVELVGGIPVLLPVYDDYRHLTEALQRLDGVLFAGGNDVNPLLYGTHPSLKTGKVSPNRDRQEIQLARYLVEDTRMPVFFICRGNQILNVALGGTLHQDLAESRFQNHSILSVPATDVCHNIAITDRSLLHQLLGKDTLEVNSLHHQAVDEVGDGLVVSARAADGVVEALELPQRDGFALAVQWHPEMLVDSYADHRKLLAAFVAKAAESHGCR